MRVAGAQALHIEDEASSVTELGRPEAEKAEELKWVFQAKSLSAAGTSGRRGEGRILSLGFGNLILAGAKTERAGTDKKLESMDSDDHKGILPGE